MSNIYIQEPPTNGKVLLITTAGDIDIELWSKEAPKACRNFVQLCMEGYYDGTVFHRVVPDFIVQGGDPTGTGEGGESIYGKPFKDEFHSRLRFVRRGLVAMANAGKNDNGSQFFITMGPTQELQNKHTIFGKVTGNTVYNLSKLQEVDIDENERPHHPHKIKTATVLSSPFDDIVPRTTKKEKSSDSEKKSKNKSQSKATKNFKLLSFGEEAEEDEAETDLVNKDMSGKSKSSHDLIDDPSLSSEVAVDVKESDVITKSSQKSDSGDGDSSEDEEENRRVKDSIREKLKESGNSEEGKRDNSDKDDSKTEALKREARRLRKELRGLDKEEEKKKEKVPEKKPPVNDMVAAYMAEKEKYKNVKKENKKGSREEVTLAMLSKFQSKLNSAKLISGGYSDDEEEEEEKKEEEEKEEEKKEEKEEDDTGDSSWMRHKLHFEDRKRKVIDANVSDVDRYEIYDPRNPMTKRRREASKTAMKDKDLNSKQKL